MVRKYKREVMEPDGQKVKKKITHRGYKTRVSMDAATRIVASLLAGWGNSAANEASTEPFAHDLALALPTHTYGGGKANGDTVIFERVEQQGMHVGVKLRRSWLLPTLTDRAPFL